MLKRGMDTAIKKPTYRKKHDWRSNTVRGTKRMTMHKYAMETLGAGNVAAAVRRFFLFYIRTRINISWKIHRSNYHPEKI